MGVLFETRGSFRFLLGGSLFIGLLLFGLWFGSWVKLTRVPTVEPGTAVICEQAGGRLDAYSVPGMYFCPSGKWSTFRLHDRVNFEAEVRLRDRNVVQIKAVVLYGLPLDPHQLTTIYQTAKDQQALNEGVVRSNGVRQLQLVFSQIDTVLLLSQSNMQRIGDAVADRTRAELMRNWGITVESFWFTGTGRAFSPRNFENQKFEHTI